MKLCETVEGMNSADYKERFKAEYQQLLIRYTGLKSMLEKWDADSLEFEPTCPRSTYNMRYLWMKRLLTCLKRSISTLTAQKL